MNTVLNSDEQKIQKPKVIHTGGGSDSVYGLGFVGAMVYYISRATSFQEGVVGFFKAIVWPAIFVYEILKLLEGIKTKDSTET